MKLWLSRKWRGAALGLEEDPEKGKKDRTREGKFLSPRCEQQGILQNAPSTEVYEGYLNP